MTLDTDDEYAALRWADPMLKKARKEGRGWDQAVLTPGQVRWLLVNAFKQGARHGRWISTRQFMQTLSDEMDARCYWQRLATELNHEVERMTMADTMDGRAKAANE